MNAEYELTKQLEYFLCNKWHELIVALWTLLSTLEKQISTWWRKRNELFQTFNFLIIYSALISSNWKYSKLQTQLVVFSLIMNYIHRGFNSLLSIMTMSVFFIEVISVHSATLKFMSVIAKNEFKLFCNFIHNLYMYLRRTFKCNQI